MKKTIVTILAAAVVCIIAVQCMSGKGPKAHSLEVTFNYQRQAIHGSNQFAVWIENETGEVVKTLFVTAFTAKGRARGEEPLVRGYIKRPYCVPTWVKDVKAETLSDEQMDAISSATPQESGLKTFLWDFTDQEGHKVKAGTYQVFVEATLFDASAVIYKGSFSTKDKQGTTVSFTSEYTVPEDDHKGMVSEVTAVLK